MTDDWDKLDDKLDYCEHLADIIESERAGMVCEVMRTMAVNYITDQHAVDTGRLRASVGSDNNEVVVRNSRTMVTMGIDCPVEYGIFIEYGTGPKGDKDIPHTTKEKWTYMGEDGKYHTAYPQNPRPFMRPALYNNIKTYKEILKGTIMDVFE